MSDNISTKKIKVIDSNQVKIVDENESKKQPRISKMITLEDYNKNNSNRRTTKIFYYCNDIKKTLQYYNLNTKGLKKNMLESTMKHLFDRLNSYEKYLDTIIFIQQRIKKNIKENQLKLYGEGFFNKNQCQNLEDFYTFETYHDISDDYFFSYKDTQDKIYYFDIRSFNKLLDSSKTPKNPYNREPISENIIKIAKKRLEYMETRGIPTKFKEPKITMTEEQLFNSRVLDIFQKIDALNVTAAGTNPKWFIDLNIIKLQKFYRNLEDIWNYRADLSLEQKKQIVPNNDLFNISINKIFLIDNLKKVRDIILNDLDKLITSGISDNHKSTGCYYILIALSEISPDCAVALPWLVQY